MNFKMKWISAVLACVMLLSMCSVLSVLATQTELRLDAGILDTGEDADFEDLKVCTTDDVAELSDVSAAVVPFEPTVLPNTPVVPQDAYAFLKTNFTNADLGDARQASENEKKIFNGGTAYAEIVDAGNNRLMRYWATDGKVHSPRVQVKLDLQAKHYSVDYAVIPSGGKTELVIYADSKQQSGIALVRDGVAGVKAREWNYVHVDIDFEKMLISGDVNGYPFKNQAIQAISNTDNVVLRFNANLPGGDVIYWDAMTVYTTDAYSVQGPLMGNQEIYWDNVKPEQALSENSFVNNLKKHPRVFVHDWDVIREKTDADVMTRKWYANLKSSADSALRTSPTAYKINSRGNVLESARSARNRIMALAFVYKITEDSKYLDRAYEEMLIYGEWPDWSGFVSTLVTAEILQGYAYCYDWLHDDLTAEQRQSIIDIVHKHALPDFIYGLEGQHSNTSFTKTSINWNPVCNATLIAWALAAADETPLVSEYLLEKAPPFIRNALPPYAPQGGYPEGVSYWDYGTTFLIFATDFLENAFVDGFELPENYIYWKAPGIADTPDFGIYYDGPAGRFNYGDCSKGHTNSVIMYWAANRFNKPHYAWWQNNRQTGTGSYLGGYDAVAALCWYDADNAYNVPGAFALDKFYTSDNSVNGGAMRSSWDESTALFGAIQGGNNKANHQHLSLGTYVIDFMGKRFVRQLDGYDYALKVPKAQTYYKRDESSNCLVINPSATASQNSNAVARTIKSGTSDNTAFIVLDTTETYAAYKSAKRGMMMTDDRSRIIVQDEVVANAPSEFYWFANTDASIAIAKDGKSALLTIDDARMLARIIEGPSEAKFEIMDRKSLFESVTQIASNKGGQKLFIHLENKTELNLAVEYVALESGAPTPMPWEYTPLDAWTVEADESSAIDYAQGATVLKLNSPLAIAKGEKRFVDPANHEVMPIIENDRTLVPIRFIAESFGAQVDWDPKSYKVDIQHGSNDITMWIGRSKMEINGVEKTLDVPANIYKDRAVIPIRALAEALGKTVYWSERGLIIIADAKTSYNDVSLEKMEMELCVRLRIGEQDTSFFTPGRESYAWYLKSNEDIPQVYVQIYDDPVAVTQASALGESATFTLYGKTYSIKFTNDPFESVVGNKDPGVINDILVSCVSNSALPTYDTFIYVEDLTDSTGFATYPERGIVDGVINTSVENRWAAQGEAWIQMDFGSMKNVHSMAFAGVSQNVRTYNFDVDISCDGINYTTVRTGGAPKTTEIMSILPLGDVQARYVRISGHGNNTNAWNTYAEVRFYDSEAQQNEDKSLWPLYFPKSGICGMLGTSAMIEVKGIDANKDVFALRSDAQVTYSVTDTSVATVSEDGNIHFLKAGKTTMRVTAKQDGFGAEKTVDIEVTE